MKQEQSPYFPLFVPLDGKQVFTVGAGKIALRRIKTMLQFGAQITVMAIDFHPELGNMADTGVITAVTGKYNGNIPDGTSLVLAVTDDRAINEMVCRDSRKCGIPVNVCDAPELCDFYFPAVIYHDGIVAGITSSGRDHRKVRSTAQTIREVLEEKHAAVENRNPGK